MREAMESKVMDSQKASNLAFLGMGVMGSAMAANLARAGFSVRVWNRTPGSPRTETAVAAGAHLAESLSEAVCDAEVVFSCLGDVDDVYQVLAGEKGASVHAKPGTIFVDLSTIGPKAARNMSSNLAAKSLQFIDAPVTGGDIGARNATLTIMAGGDEQTFAFVRPLLEKLGKTVRLCGPVGAGQALKLCNQVLCAVNMIAVCEALLLAERLAVEPELVVDVLSGGAGGSWALSNLGSRIVKKDYAPGFALKHMIKDLRLIEENLGEIEQLLPGTRLAEKLFKRLGQDDRSFYETQGTQAMVLAYRQGAACS
ncbi:MAG TPA: NAD(P)-dependent oxidoreductase [Candidatus Obscuribacterales bacterium]